MYGRNFKPKIFTDITMLAKRSYGPNIGKISVLFMISVTNLHFSEIKGTGSKSLAENLLDGENKDTKCRVGGKVVW